MSILKFNEFINESKNLVVYHGTSAEHDFTKHGDVYYGTFFSTNKNEAKSYGKYLYEVTLKDNLNIFDTIKPSDLKILFKEFGELVDDYYTEDEPEYYIKTPQQLLNHTDNWNPIERTDGVLEWLDGNYDGIWIYEGSVRNLLLFKPVNDKILQSVLI